MKTHTLFILLLFSLSAYAQQEVSYIDYHKQITAAEQQFLYFNKTAGAIKKYKEIFTAWKKPFAKDCFIALQLACMVKDTANASFFFEQCFKNGVEWNTVVFPPVVSSLLAANGDYKKRIGKLCEVYCNEYKKTIDTSYRNIIANMYKHEYGLRRKAEGSQPPNALISAWMAVEDSNMYELVPMIKRRGFPGEKRIGCSGILFKQVEDSRTGDRSYAYDFNMVSVNLNCHAATLFFHHRCGYALLKEELMQAVIEGQLHPREYALMYEWSHNYFAVKHWDDDYHDFRCEAERQEKRYNIFINPFNYSKDTTAVNSDRAEIGMCSLEHDEKKKSFAMENELYLYFGSFKKI